LRKENRLIETFGGYWTLWAAALGLCLFGSTLGVEAQSQNGTGKPAVQPAQTHEAGLKNPALPVAAPSVTQSLIDSTVPDDPAVDAMLAPYSAKVRALDAVIGNLASDIKKEGIGGGPIGNLVADGMWAGAKSKLGKPVALALTNVAGIRKNDIAAGALRASDIYELLPFDNALVTIDLTGEQLNRFLTKFALREAQSGAIIRYRTSPDKTRELISVKLNDPTGPREIEPTATYTVVTTDYLVKRGGDYAILQEGKNLTEVGVTLRNSVLEYIKSETAAGRTIDPKMDDRFVSETPEGKSRQE
jgi:2',3'-cyclic-nucleotide 2'-phosphodiesterase (5'-nucleotidase family)